MILITQSGPVTFPAWWWVMRVKGQTIVLEGTPDHRPPQFLVVAQLDSEREASALFEVKGSFIRIRLPTCGFSASGLASCSVNQVGLWPW
jgi:hypothetical protein